VIELRIEEQTAERADERGGFGLVRWVICVLLALILYVLSIGPVAKMTISGNFPLTVYSSMYSPLRAIASNYTPADRFLGWYVGEVWAASFYH